MSGKRYDHDYDVDSETGCWVWARGFHTGGYGAKFFEGKRLRAHRFYYERAKGPIPGGLQLDHLCRNRACVNPDHLEAVTGAQNNRRGASAKLTWDQVREIRRRRQEGGVTLQQLADKYGVIRATIWHIVHGKKWIEPGQPYVPVNPIPRETVAIERRSDTLCACGCGRRTNLAPVTDASKGWVKGQPFKYIRSHHPKTGLRSLRDTLGEQ